MLRRNTHMRRILTADLMKINGGGVLEGLGDAWTAIYNTGKDFGRSLYDFIN